MSKLVTPFRVGLLVLISGVLFGLTFSFVHKGGLSKRDAITVWADFHDASGLGPRSKVQIAGIAVGEITSVTLEGQKARITMLIKREVPLKVDAVISKRSESLLGDYLLDLVPGSESAQMMAEGGQITRVNDATGMDQVFGSLTKITGDISEVTGALRKTLGGEQGAESLEKIVSNLSQMSDKLNSTIASSGTNLNEILANFKDVSQDVKGITGSEETRYKTIVENVQHITEDVRDVLGTIKKVLGTGEGNMQNTVADLKETLEKLNKSLDNLSQITDKVNKGEGTVGQLINDKRLGQALTDTVVDASDYVSRLVNLQTEVTLRSEWLFSQQQDKIYLQLRLIARPDKYYTLEVVDDPSGTITQQVVQNNPPSPLQVPEQVETVTSQALKFSAQFNKRYYFATFRFGIIESTGGFGADLHFLDDALTIKFDAFDFTDPNRLYPRLKGYANYAILGHIFFTAGVDDILNDQVRDPLDRRLLVGRQILAGGGIFFTDDDLKAVISAAPKL